LPGRSLVIGDIHGCLVQLDALLDAVAPNSGDQLILLGDLVDRGRDSAGVLRRIIALKQTHDVQTVLGNHEQMMLAAPESKDREALWRINGGDATLRSYGGVFATLRNIPEDHWQFLQNDLVEYIETETHIYVHACADPTLSMSEQSNFMLRWERFENIKRHKSGKIIVCGHTPQTSGRPANLGYAICLDTNAYGGGKLTCMEMTRGDIWQADPKGRVDRAAITDF
jgi:Calcineurin-like phosphoesterase